MIRTVIAVIDDMFLASKVRATAKALGMLAVFPRSLDALRLSINDSLPDIIVVDLQHAKLDPIALGTELKANDRLAGIPVVGFFSHVEAELHRKALQAGYDEVMPRSVFFRELANVLSGEIKKA
jgi:CheY-like chemotaxis protein